MDEKILQMHADGMKSSEIGKILGCSHGTVLNHAKKLGIRFLKNPSPEITLEKIRADKENVIKIYLEGNHQRVIAKKFHCHPDVISKVLVEWGIELRKRPNHYGKLSEYEDQLRKLHAEGWSYCKIADFLGFDSSSVLTKCARMGLTFIPPEKKIYDIDRIIDLNNKGFSTRSIATKVGSNHTTIRQILQKAEQNTSDWTHKFNKNFFKQIDHQNKAYCLGLMMSDGFVQHGRVGLNMTDRDVIEKFKKILEYDGEIREIIPEDHTHQIKHEVNLYSVEMTNDLEKYNIDQNKSLVLKFPDLSLIPEDLISHLIRGIYDGDGGIGYDSDRKQYYVGITGTKEVLTTIKYLAPVRANVIYHGGDSGSNTWHWRVTKQEDMLILLDWLYKGSEYYMERKYEKAIELANFLIKKNYKYRSLCTSFWDESYIK
jgi:transposase